MQINGIEFTGEDLHHLAPVVGHPAFDLLMQKLGKFWDANNRLSSIGENVFANGQIKGKWDGIGSAMRYLDEIKAHAKDAPQPQKREVKK